jgi:hypothetical protein
MCLRLTTLLLHGYASAQVQDVGSVAVELLVAVELVVTLVVALAERQVVLDALPAPHPQVLQHSCACAVHPAW